MRLFKRPVAPFVMPGGSAAELVGESYHQTELSALAGGKHEESAHMRVTAVLVAEPKNPHDANAIRVEVNGKLVGHLARPDALRYQGVMTRLAELGRRATCGATIVGGWKNSDGEGHFGIKIDLAPPDEVLRELRK